MQRPQESGWQWRTCTCSREISRYGLKMQSPRHFLSGTAIKKYPTAEAARACSSLVSPLTTVSCCVELSKPSSL